MTDLLDMCVKHVTCSMRGNREIARFVAQLSTSNSHFRDHPDITRFLGDIETATQDMFLADTPAAIEDAFARGADPNALHRGYTVLQHAALRGQVDIMRCIVEHDDLRDIDALSTVRHFPVTALHQAFCNGSEEAVELLLECCADPDVEMSCGCTLLHHAIRKDDPGMMDILLKFGANVNARDLMNGFTPLHVAVSESYVDLAETLLECKDIDVNARDNSGETALYLAVCSSDDYMVDLLLRARAVPDQYDIEAAVTDGSLVIIDALLGAYGDNLEPVDIQRLCKIAEDEGLDEVATLLRRDYM